METNTAPAAIEASAQARLARATNPSYTIEQSRLASLYEAHNPAGSTFTRRLGPKAKAAGLRGATWTPEQIAELIPAGGAVVLYSSFGHVRGMERFGRSTFVASAHGEGISVIDKDGNVAVGYRFSQGRTLRLLVK